MAIRQLMKQRYQGTGYAFVTFNKYQVASAVCEELPKSLFGQGASARVAYLFGGQMRVCRAPEPEDLLWENLQFSTRQQWVRQAVSSALALVLVLVGTVAIFAANLYVAPGMMAKVASFPIFLGLYLASILLLAAGHLGAPGRRGHMQRRLGDAEVRAVVVAEGALGRHGRGRGGLGDGLLGERQLGAQAHEEVGLVARQAV